MTIVVDNQYLGSVYLYLVLYYCQNIKIEQYEAFQKMSFRNRCIIAGAEGPVVLSIPLQKGREQKVLITEVRIANQYSWQEQHWRAIKSCYGRSPWFEFYMHELEKFYNTPYELLFDWNNDLRNWILKKLQMDILSDFTTGFQKIYEPAEYLDLRNELLPKNYTSFPCPEYWQVFQERTGFLPNLSVLDLLFCKGKNAKQYLENFSLV
jgi:hypothetical protein